MTETKRLPVVVHIGFPKAASTFLQGFFDDHDEVDFCHVNLKALGSDGTVCEDFGSVTNNRNLKVRLISNEKIAEAIIVTGEIRVWNKNRFTPGAWKTVEPHIRFDPAETARRVKSGFRADKIIIVLREQSSWLTSAYKFFLPRIPSNRRSFKDFLQTPRGILYGKMAQYHETVDAYVDVFGAENVCVLSFEDLVENRSFFEETVCDFLAISPVPMPLHVANKGSSDAVASLRAGFPILDRMPPILKRYGKTLINALPSISSPILDERQTLKIKDQFALSNKKLAKTMSRTFPPQNTAAAGTRPPDQPNVTTKSP